MTERKRNPKLVYCPVDSHPPLVKMQHASAPQFCFWMCDECDMAWLDLADVNSRKEHLSLVRLYGDHAWPLIEEGYIVKAPDQQEGG